MSRRSVVVATYQPTADETFQVRVEAADAYPDALAQATSEAIRGVRELTIAAVDIYGGLAVKMADLEGFDALVAQAEEADDETD